MAHERQWAPANWNRWRRAKVSKVTSPTTDLSHMQSRCHVANSNVATKWWVMTKTHCSSLFCNLGHHSKYPASHRRPNPPHWNTGQRCGMTTMRLLLFAVIISLSISVSIVHKEYPCRLPFMGFVPAQPSWNPYLYPLNTHTHMRGHGFCRVRVRVIQKWPWGYPCSSLIPMLHFIGNEPKTCAYGTALGLSFSAGHGSPGASPLDPLVHISSPSPYTHVKSQSPCSISLDFFFFQTVQIKIHIYVLLVNK